MTSLVSFDELRAVGMNYLRRLAPASWTDHNAHDPGITLLEVLCYALSDLARRADYGVADMLTAPEGHAVAGALYSAPEVLSCDPVTDGDLRRVILDIPGVRNAWVEPVTEFTPELYYDPAEDSLCLGPEPHRQRVALRGLWRVLVEGEGDASQDEALRDRVRERLHRWRRLGEDFEPPVVLGRQPVSVIAEIEIRDGCDRDVLLREVARVLEIQVSPRVTFRSLEEMLARGYRMEEIIRGPWLERGFIDPVELERLKRPAGLRASDFLSALMEIDGVTAISDLRLKSGELTERWYLPLENEKTTSEKTPRLSFEGCTITLRRGDVRWTVSGALWKRIAEEAEPSETSGASNGPPLELQAGRYRSPDSYHSIHRHLPRVYGLGPEGLPAGASPERQAQARQLAAYLSCFDQVLGRSFSQWGNLRTLFSLESQSTYAPPVSVDGALLGEILDPAMDWNDLESPSHRNPVATDRNQRLLGHLLARFGEEFTGFSLFRDPDVLHQAQREFLSEFPAISGGRGRGFDYTRPSWGRENAENVSGLERRVALKLGLSGYCRRPLAGLSSREAGGFHLIEHILMRPGQADLEQWRSSDGAVAQWKPLTFLARPRCPDPYSARLTFVFPTWADAFRDSEGSPGEFRRFIEATVRDETPAHLAVDVLWLNPDAMGEFELAYQIWLESMITAP